MVRRHRLWYTPAIVQPQTLAAESLVALVVHGAILTVLGGFAKFLVARSRRPWVTIVELLACRAASLSAKRAELR
jgi:hypothetical protein